MGDVTEDVANLFGGPATPVDDSVVELKEEKLDEETDEVKEKRAKEDKRVKSQEMHDRLYAEVVTAKAERYVDDIPLSDEYWNKLNTFQVHATNAKYQ